MVGWILFLSLLFSVILGEHLDTETQLKTICDFMMYVTKNDSLNCNDSAYCLSSNDTASDCFVTLDHLPDLGFKVSNNQYQLVDISKLWENMSFVTMIYLDSIVYGSLPSFISNFNNLTDIHIIGSPDYQYTVHGTIPDLSHLTKLTQLDFDRNPGLSGTIPTSIGLLKDLYLFYCRNCTSLSGTIPTEILLLNQLAQLALNNCSLNGTIPNVGNALPLLEVINLQDNHLTGTIPNFINQPNLRRFNVGDNDLTGTIPYITYTSKLLEFNVSDNHLVGVIPTPLSTCVQEKYDISGNDDISGNFTCDYPNSTIIDVNGADICNCPDFLTLPNCPNPPNCAVPCNSSTTVGCIGNTKIIYGDTNITDIISPGDYVIGGNLNLNNTIIISNSTIIISNDLNLLPGSTLELNNSTIIINGNLILGDNSNTIINANQPITVNGCAYLQGNIQSTVPDPNSTSGTFSLIYTNCTNGDFNSTTILPNPDSSASGCFHAQVVKNPFSLDVNYDYTCESTLPLPLILGLCIGIPGFFIVVAIIFTVVTPLRNLIRPYSKKNKSVEEVDDGEEEEEEEDIAEA